MVSDFECIFVDADGGQFLNEYSFLWIVQQSIQKSCQVSFASTILRIKSVNYIL